MASGESPLLTKGHRTLSYDNVFEAALNGDLATFEREKRLSRGPPKRQLPWPSHHQQKGTKAQVEVRVLTRQRKDSRRLSGLLQRIDQPLGNRESLMLSVVFKRLCDGEARLNTAISRNALLLRRPPTADLALVEESLLSTPQQRPAPAVLAPHALAASFELLRLVGSPAARRPPTTTAQHVPKTYRRTALVRDCVDICFEIDHNGDDVVSFSEFVVAYKQGKAWVEDMHKWHSDVATPVTTAATPPSSSPQRRRRSPRRLCTVTCPPPPLPPGLRLFNLTTFLMLDEEDRCCVPVADALLMIEKRVGQKITQAQMLTILREVDPSIAEDSIADLTFAHFLLLLSNKGQGKSGVH